jgi:hypothetical protein
MEIKDNNIKVKFRNIVKKSTLKEKPTEEEWAKFKKIFIEDCE